MLRYNDRQIFSIPCRIDQLRVSSMATVPSVDDDRSASSVRVLVVEDYATFRRFVCSTLGKRPELQIVGEASDGLDAVQMTEELRPDLIVLDIGLPALNGIEAARRIRKLSPKSKKLFVSQESSADVVEEALRLGALGYVVKSHAGCILTRWLHSFYRSRAAGRKRGYRGCN